MENQFLDTPEEIRKEDLLDIQTLQPFLAEKLNLDIIHLDLKQFSGGASNLTYQIT